MCFECESCKKQVGKNIPQSKIIRERVVSMEGGKTRKEICSEEKVCSSCSFNEPVCGGCFKSLDFCSFCGFTYCENCDGFEHECEGDLEEW